MQPEELQSFPVSTETFEVASSEGICYRVIFERMPDNSVVTRKKSIDCSIESSERAGIYDTRNLIFGKFPNRQRRYWYIPFDGLPQEIPGEPTIECFCEEQIGEPCHGQGECNLTGSGKWIWCATDICCNDCDARICIDARCVPVGSGGILAEASSVTIEPMPGSTLRETTAEFYFGNNVSIAIIRTETSVFAHRTLLDQDEIYPATLINLTSLNPNGNSLDEAANGLHWFIPFDLSNPARSIYGFTPHCVSDGCKTECTMVTGTSGCLECKCTGNGDCDLEPNYATGGILVETQNLQVIDN